MMFDNASGAINDQDMKSITFTIEKAEVERIAGKKLKPKELEAVLSTVENDVVLWDDIEESIASAYELQRCNY